MVDRKDSVEVAGATIGEVLGALTTQYSRPPQESLQRRG
jgi:hypothetical protein